jgi:protein-L-isoaspartate(D-aspartate) O-methyltransferase
MNLEQARFNMIEQQIRPWDVLDQTVLDVMTRVPRDSFVPESQQKFAYADIEIPLGHGEAMMHPRVEGRMLQELSVMVDDTCLEVGTGSGYVTACLAHLAQEVYSVDIHSDFIETATQKLAANNISNVTLETRNALTELDTARQYDVIAVTGSVETYTPYFEQMLNPDGRLYITVGAAPVMTAMLVTRTGENAFSRVRLYETELQSLQGIEKKQHFDF